VTTHFRKSYFLFLHVVFSALCVEIPLFYFATNRYVNVTFVIRRTLHCRSLIVRLLVLKITLSTVCRYFVSGSCCLQPVCVGRCRCIAMLVLLYLLWITFFLHLPDSKLCFTGVSYSFFGDELCLLLIKNVHDS